MIEEESIEKLDKHCKKWHQDYRIISGLFSLVFLCMLFVTAFSQGGKDAHYGIPITATFTSLFGTICVGSCIIKCCLNRRENRINQLSTTETLKISIESPEVSPTLQLSTFKPKSENKVRFDIKPEVTIPGQISLKDQLTPEQGARAPEAPEQGTKEQETLPQITPDHSPESPTEPAFRPLLFKLALEKKKKENGEFPSHAGMTRSLGLTPPGISAN